MIRTSNLIHKGIVNLDADVSVGNTETNCMVFGNKITLLGGDYLLSISCRELAALKNQDVSIYIYYMYTHTLLFSLFLNTLYKLSCVIVFFDL